MNKINLTIESKRCLILGKSGGILFNSKGREATEVADSGAHVHSNDHGVQITVLLHYTEGFLLVLILLLVTKTTVLSCFLILCYSSPVQCIIADILLVELRWFYSRYLSKYNVDIRNRDEMR